MWTYLHFATTFSCKFSYNVLQAVGLSDEDLAVREVDFMDIATDPLPEHKYKAEEVKL